MGNLTEDEDAWLNSPVCIECGCHPEEGEDHDEDCPESAASPAKPTDPEVPEPTVRDKADGG